MQNEGASPEGVIRRYWVRIILSLLLKAYILADANRIDSVEGICVLCMIERTLGKKTGTSNINAVGRRKSMAVVGGWEVVVVIKRWK